jgi:hypothetical protein
MEKEVVSQTLGWKTQRARRAQESFIVEIDVVDG